MMTSLQILFQNFPKTKLLGALTVGLLTFGTQAFSQGKFNPDTGKEQVLSDLNPTDVIHWDAVTATTLNETTVEIALRVRTEQEFTLYKDKVTFSGPTGFELDKVVGPKLTKIVDPLTNKEVEVYAGGEFILTFTGEGARKLSTFLLSIKFIGCTSRICLMPYTQHFTMTVYHGEGELAPAVASADSSTQSGVSLEEEWAEKLKSGGFSFWMLFVVVFVGGLLTNLTPCVAPMIPITVRLLANQNFSPFLNASLYASGILITYTTLGVAATLSGSAFGTFMSSVPLNLAFAALMFVLGLTMLGYGNLTFLQTIGSRIGSGKPSARNTFLMGAAAGLVAAPCTGPILGALLAYSAGAQSPTQSILLMFTYSLGFSLPYVFLGSVASKSSKVKVSPRVQVGIKMVFAGVMFGLALYYLRVPAYDFFKTLKSQWQTLAMFGLGAGVVTSIVCLAMPALQNLKIALAVPAVFLGLGLFSAAQWATTDQSAEGHGYKIYSTLEEGIAQAQLEGKPILLDNWAEWCEACKKMDVTTFKDKLVIEELSRNWVVVKLDLTESNEVNDAHLAKFEIQGLPTLVLLPSDGNVTKKKSIVGYVGAAGLMGHLKSAPK